VLTSDISRRNISSVETCYFYINLCQCWGNYGCGRCRL